MAAHQAPPSLGFSRQEYWSGVPLPSLLGRIRELDIIEYFPPKASYFLVVPPEDCRGNIIGPDGVEERSVKQEGRRQSTTFERMT